MNVYDSVVALLPERATRTLQAKDETPGENQGDESDTDDF